MGNRYSDIRRGAQLARDLTNYTTYLSTPREPRVNSRGARATQRTLYITPFGQDIAAAEVVRARSAADSYTALQPYLVSGNGAQVDTAPGANSTIRIPGFRAARVVWFRNSTRSVQEVRSRVTNRAYLKYNGDTDSCVFGRATASDDEMDVFNAIKDDILQANAGLAVNRVSLTRERIGA